MRLNLIAGARPNFVKISSIIDAITEARLLNNSIEYRLIHTGQHYDANMSESFFEDLGIPKPHINLECGGGTQAEQTANIMVRFEKYLANNPADLVLVVGDVTSTLACSIVAKKMCIDVAHVEAGIRSGDLTMPEEINRIVTDSITDIFFTTSAFANENLKNNGINEKKIFFVGNTMIDTLLKNRHRFTPPGVFESLSLQPGRYFVLTLHRPSNVDNDEQLVSLLQNIVQNAEGVAVLFPVHPRTGQRLKRLNYVAKNLYMIEPLPYLQFNYLVEHAKGVITDSGGITEEATAMHVPCITLRNTTERPETVVTGTNELAGTDTEALRIYMNKILRNAWKKGSIPELWDGMAGKRIIEILLSLYGSNHRAGQKIQINFSK